MNPLTFRHHHTYAQLLLMAVIMLAEAAAAKKAAGQAPAPGGSAMADRGGKVAGSVDLAAPGAAAALGMRPAKYPFLKSERLKRESQQKQRTGAAAKN